MLRRAALLSCLAVALLGLLPTLDACIISSCGISHNDRRNPTPWTRACDIRWPAHQSCPTRPIDWGLKPINFGGCPALNSAPESCNVTCGAGGGSVITFNLESNFADFRILVNGYYLNKNYVWTKATSCNSPATCNATSVVGSPSTPMWYNLNDVMSINTSTSWGPWGSTTYFGSSLYRDGNEVTTLCRRPGQCYNYTNAQGQIVPVSGIQNDWPPMVQVLYNNTLSPWNCSNNATNWVVVHANLRGRKLCSTWAYTRSCANPGPAVNVLGDPQFAGLRGQSYQVHGVDGGIYNIISDKYMQLNSKFVFLTGPRPCPMIPTTGRKSVACFQHAGSYLGNLALRTNAGDRVLIESGPAETGFTAVQVNGRQLDIAQNVTISFDNGLSGSITYTSTHEVTLVAGLFEIEMENSDEFLNLRTVLVRGSNWEKLTEEKAHGLLGQTWQVRKGKSAIEGKVDDYMLMSDDLYGTDFMYNRFGVSDEKTVVKADVQ